MTTATVVFGENEFDIKVTFKNDSVDNLSPKKIAQVNRFMLREFKLRHQEINQAAKQKLMDKRIAADKVKQAAEDAATKVEVDTLAAANEQAALKKAGKPYKTQPEKKAAPALVVAKEPETTPEKVVEEVETNESDGDSPSSDSKTSE